MIVLLSPSKTISAVEITNPKICSKPRFHKDADFVMSTLKGKSKEEVKKMMRLSDVLTDEVYGNIKNFRKADERLAMHNYTGAVYIGLDAKTLSDEDILWAKNRLIILSAVYGALSVTDGVRPYRLEMQTSFAVGEHTSLYSYWRPKLTKYIKSELKAIKNKDDQFILDLASAEYTKVVFKKDIEEFQWINVEFKERINGELKFITYNAKKARGLMARYVIDERIDSIIQLQKFNYEGYYYNEKLSTAANLVFIKE